jgi:nitrate/nitrite transport system permease protein
MTIDKARIKAPLLSFLFLLALLGLWQVSTQAPAVATGAGKDEYARLMGAGDPQQAVNGFPTPGAVAAVAIERLSRPFYDNGPNDKGIGIQLAFSLGRVALGYLIALVVALPLGFAIGMSPLLHRVLDPFLQILKPISPLAWMPIALYTIRDSTVSSVFVIFICSLWPMLLNTAFGVANVRREWLNVARTLEVSPLRTAFFVILPAAAPAIITGMRISMGIAWLVIVAAEMLIGGVGVGYLLWNEWNSLSIANVVFAVALIGVVGMTLDALTGLLQKKVTYAE